MTRRLTELYPFLLAAAAVLSMAAGNPGKFDLADLLQTLAFTVACFALVHLLAALAAGGRADGRLPALLTLLAVVGVFGIPPVARSFQGGPKDPRNVAVVLLAVAATGLAARWLTRRPRRLQTAATFLTVTGALLVVRLAADIAADQMRARGDVAESALARELARPIDGAAPAAAPRRDIYLLVLDEYANAAVLRERFGFDNSVFEDSLRTLGFHIPAEVRSNYFHTILSLPSLLNAAHLHRVESELPEGATDPTLVNRLLERSRVASFLKNQGYRYVFFPSLWWEPTQETALADSVVRVWRGFNPARTLSRTEFRRELQKATVLRYFLREDPLDHDHVRRTFESFGRLPSVPAPVFAFAHVLTPHWPYVFERNCRQSRPTGPADRVVDYVEQLECVNSMVLGLVTHLIHDSEVAPIILLQGDHGTKTLRYSKAPSAGLVGAEAARERFGAFGAYYLPDSGAAAFGDTVTVVNVLGNVLRHYFAARLPREPDDLYLSLQDTPYEFRRSGEPFPSSSQRIQGGPRLEETGSISPTTPPRRPRGST
jgi:hypothetical protein